MPRQSDSYLDPYREAVARFGPGFEATLWATRESQQLRFDVMIDLAGSLDDCVIIDAGCGSGDFAARLVERAVPFRRYLGLDAIPQVIEEARRRNLPRCVFQVLNVLDPAAMTIEAADYICFSGTLNTMDEEVARGLVRSAFDAAGRGVIFNFLSSRHHPRWNGRDIGPARRFDPVAWLDWALQLSSGVSFTQAYLDGHDATILILRDKGE